MELLTGVTDAALQPRILAHYHRTAPLIENSLAGTPIVFANYPAGLSKPPVFHRTSIPLSRNKLLWLVHAKYAIEFYTWAPLASDLDRLRFARILLEPPAGVAFERVKLAALAMRALLFDAAKLEAIPLLDGGAGIALWIPLADAPHAVPLRAWLHQLCARAVALHPGLLSTEVNTHHDGRVHLHVTSNAEGHYSAVPYSLRSPDLTVCTPIAWPELGTYAGANAFGDEEFAARLAKKGDVFAAELAVIVNQRFADVPSWQTVTTTVPEQLGTTPAPRGRIINAAIEILDDGKPRTADELLAEALQRKLVPPETKRKYIYSALIEYIARQLGRGRKPPLVQDALRRFCINEPPDDWPDFSHDWPSSQPQPGKEEEAAAVQALCDRLETTASGDDPTAFETAVCDAFAHLGFLTQHLGARAEPDGVADAILGTLGYRILIECKTAKHVVTQPDAAESAKFRGAYRAQYSVLVGPEFSDETELLQELQTHRVTALTAGNLQTLLHVGATALEVRAVLQPGYGDDVIGDLLWERRHGAAKRVATVAHLIAREGWKAQLTAAQQGGAPNAPQLTADAAMFLVDESLRNAGSAQACTRDDVAQAFEALTNPIVQRAVWADDARSSLVIVAMPNAPPG